MENPTIYESMEEYHRDCYNPLEDITLIGFTIGSVEYCIKINYDDCLKGRISICQGIKGEFPVLTYAYLTSGHIFFAYCNEGTLVDRCIDILYSEEGEHMILDDIYSRYIDCLSHPTNKISDDERIALRQRYIIDREACKSVAKDRKVIISGTDKDEDQKDPTKCFSFDPVYMFNLTHNDKYYFIKSPDVRKYLESINHQFNKAELMYLIYNSHLSYVEKMDAMASELAKGGFEEEGLEWLKEQVISRINYMETSMNIFADPEANTVYNVEFLGNAVIPGPLFTSAEAACQYALNQNHRKNNFRITKRRINCTSEVRADSLCGVELYNAEGVLLDCTIARNGLLIGSDENRFENDITVNIPHPFEKGHIVTDGSTIYYVKEPNSITAMWNNINMRSKSEFDGKNNDFCIDCYCFGTENGTNAEDIVILNCDVRNLTFVETGSNELTRIASILKVFGDKYSKSEECCEKG